MSAVGITAIIISVLSCVACVVVCMMMMPMLSHAMKRLTALRSNGVRRSFSQSFEVMSPFGNNVVIRIEGEVLGGYTVPMSVFESAMIEMGHVLSDGDHAFGSCVMSRHVTTDVNGVPVEATRWVLEADGGRLWTGVTDDDGTVIETYVLDPGETVLHLASTDGMIDSDAIR